MEICNSGTKQNASLSPCIHTLRLMSAHVLVCTQVLHHKKCQFANLTNGSVILCDKEPNFGSTCDGRARFCKDHKQVQNEPSRMNWLFLACIYFFFMHLHSLDIWAFPNIPAYALVHTNVVACARIRASFWGFTWFESHVCVRL
jgi:hypothetical protein